MVAKYVHAYRRYCWPTEGLKGLKLAPFHLLASEGVVHTDKSHEWPMETLARLAAVDSELLIATPFRLVDLESQTAVQAATNWWADLTRTGGESMVVKPLDFVARNSRGLIQPALKCRGREYRRIIHGPEYDLPQTSAWTVREAQPCHARVLSGHRSAHTPCEGAAVAASAGSALGRALAERTELQPRNRVARENRPLDTKLIQHGERPPRDDPSYIRSRARWTLRTPAA